MFDNLTERLSSTIKKIRGQGKITEANIQETLREVRMALLEADVALPVVKDFVEQVKQKAMGQNVVSSLTAGQTFIKIVNRELVTLMGEANDELNLKVEPPAVVLMAGLQGSGKTTSTAKLSRWLIERKKKKVAVVSCDIYRPAAIEQLKTLAADVGATFYASEANEKPVHIAKKALKLAKNQHMDVLIVDTAGRLHVDEQMMAEIREIHKIVTPVETLFVVDSMTGQDAANTAKAFNDVLSLTGVVLTKVDGDARGGAALSIRHITGKPIKFLGMGEKTHALEPFHPDRLASRILGMGDMLTLIEDMERNVDQKKAEKLAKKLKKGKGFDLADFRDQLLQIENMGGVMGMAAKLPGMGGMMKNVKEQAAGKETKRLVSIINSMTKQERRFPDLIKGSRKKRIAAGSGVQVQDVNRLLKQFSQMQKMMKQMTKGGMAKMLKRMKNMPGGGMPGGGMPGGGMPF